MPTALPVSRSDTLRFVPLEARAEALRRMLATETAKDDADPDAIASLEELLAAASEERDAVEPSRRPAYLLKVPTFVEVSAWRRDIQAAGAAYPGDAVLFSALRDQVREVSPENEDELIELVDRVESIGISSLEGPDASAFNALCETVRRFGGRFTALEADRGHWLNVAPWLACKHFLLGWENGPEGFERKGGLVTETALAKLHRSAIVEVGLHVVQTLLRLADDTAKN